eukprot:g3708.t1
MLVGTSIDSASRLAAPSIFGASQSEEKIIISKSPDKILSLPINSCFQNFNGILLKKLTDISDVLDGNTCSQWMEVYKGLHNLRFLWSHLMEMKNFQLQATKAYPPDQISLLVSIIQCNITSVKTPDFDSEMERNLMSLRMMTMCWNEAFRMMLLVCTNTRASDKHIYKESVVSNLTKHMEDQGKEFIINYTAATNRISELVKEAAVSLKDSETNLHILDVIAEVEVALNHFSSLISNPLFVLCLRDAIPDKLILLLTSGLELVQHPIQNPAARKATRIGTRKVRVTVPSNVAHGGLEKIAAKCLTILAQFQDSHVVPISFQKLLETEEIKLQLIKFSSLVWNMAETVLRRPSLSECPVYQGESEIFMNLVIVLPKLAAADDPILVRSDQGAQIIADILSANHDQFVSMWCGGIISKLLICDKSSNNSNALSLCYDYEQQQEILVKKLCDFTRSSGEKFTETDSAEELHRALGLLHLIVVFIRRHPEQKKQSFQSRPLHEMISAQIQRQAEDWTTRCDLARRIDDNICDLVRFLHPVIGETILPNEVINVAEKLGMDIRQDINRIRV